MCFAAFCSFGYCGANFGAALTSQVILFYLRLIKIISFALISFLFIILFHFFSSLPSLLFSSLLLSSFLILFHFFQFGSLLNGITNTARKAVTLALSFALFPERNNLEFHHVFGGCVFFCGLIVRAVMKGTPVSAEMNNDYNSNECNNINSNNSIDKLDENGNKMMENYVENYGNYSNNNDYNASVSEKDYYARIHNNLNIHDDVESAMVDNSSSFLNEKNHASEDDKYKINIIKKDIKKNDNDISNKNNNKSINHDVNKNISNNINYSGINNIIVNTKNKSANSSPYYHSPVQSNQTDGYVNNNDNNNNGNNNNDDNDNNDDNKKNSIFVHINPMTQKNKNGENGVNINSRDSHTHFYDYSSNNQNEKIIGMSPNRRSRESVPTTV